MFTNLQCKEIVFKCREKLRNRSLCWPNTNQLILPSLSISMANSWVSSSRRTKIVKVTTRVVFRESATSKRATKRMQQVLIGIVKMGGPPALEV